MRWRENVWILSAFCVRGGGERTMDEADFYIVNVQSPSRGVLHQDQDLNNVAFPLSRRHTLHTDLLELTRSLLFPKA